MSSTRAIYMIRRGRLLTASARKGLRARASFFSRFVPPPTTPGCAGGGGCALAERPLSRPPSLATQHIHVLGLEPSKPKKRCAHRLLRASCGRSADTAHILMSRENRSLGASLRKRSRNGRNLFKIINFQSLGSPRDFLKVSLRSVPPSPAWAGAN